MLRLTYCITKNKKGLIAIVKGENFLITARKLSRVYASGQIKVEALKEANLTVERGKFYAIMGPSGSGKTTLLQILGLLDKPTAGELYIEGTPVRDLPEAAMARLRMKKIGFVFQFFHLLPHLKAWENVVFPMLANPDISARERKEKAVALLKSVGLGDRIDHFPKQLSGGEQQRVAIARSLANDPDIILADEPTGNVDAENEQRIIEILKELCTRGKTVIVVTHNEEVGRAADEVFFLNRGLLERGTRHAPV